MRGVTAEHLERVNKCHAISITAMFNLLVDKGIITFDEFVAARMEATHEIDQLSAEQRDQHDIEAAYELGRLYARFHGTARGE